MTDIAQVDAAPPTAIITLDPQSYVAAIYAPFREKLDAAKKAADEATFDVTTTAGMEVAKKHRAVFRDEFRLAIEKARTERKAPILEIGRLLDGKAKEIAAEVEPYEKRFDDAIKAEERRKDAEKQAKLAAEKARVDGIRKLIDEIKTCPTECVGQSAAAIQGAINELSAHEITLEEFMEFAGEADQAKCVALGKMQDALTAQQSHEAEQARLAAEREALAKERAEAAERERQAAAERAAQEARDRAERERVEAEQRAAQEKAEALMRAEREAHERRMAEERAALAREQAAVAAQRAEAERIERERLAAIEAEAQSKREAAEAEERRKREETEAAARAEAQRIADEQAAAEAERVRRERVQFELNGPGDVAIVELLAAHYGVTNGDVVGWLERFNVAAFEAQMEKAA
ncbi:MAG: hypothetical protein AAFO57_00360 [Pseudomonadota bacterium]